MERSGPILAVAGVIVLFVSIFGFDGIVEIVGAVAGALLLATGMKQIRGG